MEDDLVMVEANAMDFVVTDLVILNKKDKVPPDYTVVSVISRLGEFVKMIAFLILILFCFPKTDCVHVMDCLAMSAMFVFLLLPPG